MKGSYTEILDLWKVWTQHSWKILEFVLISELQLLRQDTKNPNSFQVVGTSTKRDFLFKKFETWKEDGQWWSSTYVLHMCKPSMAVGGTKLFCKGNLWSYTEPSNVNKPTSVLRISNRLPLVTDSFAPNKELCSRRCSWYWPSQPWALCWWNNRKQRLLQLHHFHLHWFTKAKQEKTCYSCRLSNSIGSTRPAWRNDLLAWSGPIFIHRTDHVSEGG